MLLKPSIKEAAKEKRIPLDLYKYIDDNIIYEPLIFLGNQMKPTEKFFEDPVELSNLISKIV